MDLALKTGCPVVGLNDGGGARIQKASWVSRCTARSSTRNVIASASCRSYR